MPNSVAVLSDEIMLGEYVTVWFGKDFNFGQGGQVKSLLNGALVITDPIGFDHTFLLSMVDVCKDVPFPLTDCIQYDALTCFGDVEHFSPSGMGGPLRCEHHRNLRQISYESSIERYAQSDLAPAWFDEMNIGERWNED